MENRESYTAPNFPLEPVCRPRRLMVAEEVFDQAEQILARASRGPAGRHRAAVDRHRLHQPAPEPAGRPLPSGRRAKHLAA